jgi:hypothetical protein
MVKYLLPSILLLGCRPDFSDRTSELERLRVLAIRSDPPEATPGSEVRLTALVADDQGGFQGLPLDWAFCTKPRPLDEPNAVSIKCFAGEADWIEPIGAGDSVVATLPNNACRQFGSDVPEPKEGEPPGRPADPDPTGGYYQPTRLIVAHDPRPILALGQTRLICGLPGSTREVSDRHRRLYHANANPRIVGVDLVVDGVDQGPIDTKLPAKVKTGAKVAFRVVWPDCPSSTSCGDGICGGEEDVTSCAADCTTVIGCGGAESYLQYDLVSRELVPRREEMRASFVGNGGAFDLDRVGRAENDPNSFADDGWTAPASPGRYEMFAVLRDSRGGVDWWPFSVVVE